MFPWRSPGPTGNKVVDAKICWHVVEEIFHRAALKQRLVVLFIRLQSAVEGAEALPELFQFGARKAIRHALNTGTIAISLAVAIFLFAHHAGDF